MTIKRKIRQGLQVKMQKIHVSNSKSIAQGRKNERIVYKLKVFDRKLKRDKYVKVTTKDVRYICMK